MAADLPMIIVVLEEDITVGPLKIELRSLRVDTSEEGDAIVEVVLNTHDRDTFEPTTIVTSHRYNGWSKLPSHERAELIARTLTLTFQHEVFEHLQYDGERIFDPHKGE